MFMILKNNKDVNIDFNTVKSFGMNGLNRSIKIKK